MKHSVLGTLLFSLSLALSLGVAGTASAVPGETSSPMSPSQQVSVSSGRCGVAGAVAPLAIPAATKSQCYQQYVRDSAKCRRMPGAKARGACWVAIMAKQAACMAGASDRVLAVEP